MGSNYYYDHEVAAREFAGGAAGAMADKVTEEGKKLFTSGIKRIAKSRGIVCSHLAMLHFQHGC